MPPGDRAPRAAAVCDTVTGLAAFRDAGVVMAFVAVRDELDTAALCRRVLADGKVLVLPRTTAAGIEVVPSDLADLAPGAFGIPEPTGDAVDPAVVDLVVVPGLAFDRDGRRLGTGGGYYDRLLPRLRPDAVVIGVCFTEQLLDRVPTEATDVAVAVVIAG